MTTKPFECQNHTILEVAGMLQENNRQLELTEASRKRLSDWLRELESSRIAINQASTVLASFEW